MISADAQVDVAKMAAFQRAIREGMVDGLIQAGKHIVDLASQLAPEDTGDLKRSGRSFVNGTTLEVSFGNELPDDRAIAQEYGTVYMAAQPYLGPAIKEIDVLEEVAKAVRSRLI